MNRVKYWLSQCRHLVLLPLLVFAVGTLVDQWLGVFQASSHGNAPWFILGYIIHGIAFLASLLASGGYGLILLAERSERLDKIFVFVSLGVSALVVLSAIAWSGSPSLL